MKKIAVLGSTGSIGTQTLDVVRAHPELFHVSVLAANASDELLQRQIEEFRPELAVLSDEAAYGRLKSRYHGATELAGGRQAFIDAAAFGEVDTVVTSMMGFAGLEPTMKALEAKKNIALANKETLVVAGEIVMRRAKEQSSACRGRSGTASKNSCSPHRAGRSGGKRRRSLRMRRRSRC